MIEDYTKKEIELMDSRLFPFNCNYCKVIFYPTSVELEDNQGCCNDKCNTNWNE